MKLKTLCLFILVSVSAASITIAQKKIVVMGSSTAAGSNASSYANTWVGKMTALFQQNMVDGVDTVVHNIAEYGYSTYHEMPTSFVPPPARPLPDPLHNVTMALSYTPDIVIINLPSNDIAFGYTKKEMMDNLRLMYLTITATGAKCFIGTTAPRNDITAAQCLLQRELVDSINNNFGVFSLNFWDDLVTTDGLNRLRDEVRDPGSDYHLNDAGHNYMYLRVRDKQIFTVTSGPLPIKLTSFEAVLKNNTVVLKWNTQLQEANTGFEVQRSSDGRSFETVLSQQIPEARQAADYSATDLSPLPGKSFYRLKINEAGQIIYSNTISVQMKEKNLSIHKLYKDNSSGSLIADISVINSQKLIISIISTTGTLLQQQSHFINKPYGKITIPINTLSSGQYYLRVQGEGNAIEVKAFTK